MSPEIQDRAARIKLLLMDCDGVLTDGTLLNVPGPERQMVETKVFDSQDGIALQWLTWNGIQTGVISGRVRWRSTERARQVKMTYVYQGHIEKIPILVEIAAEERHRAERDRVRRRRSHRRRLHAARGTRNRDRQRARRGEARRPLCHGGGRRQRGDPRSVRTAAEVAKSLGGYFEEIRSRVKVRDATQCRAAALC